MEIEYEHVLSVEAVVDELNARLKSQPKDPSSLTDSSPTFIHAMNTNLPILHLKSLLPILGRTKHLLMMRQTQSLQQRLSVIHLPPVSPKLLPVEVLVLVQVLHRLQL